VRCHQSAKRACATGRFSILLLVLLLASSLLAAKTEECRAVRRSFTVAMHSVRWRLLAERVDAKAAFMLASRAQARPSSSSHSRARAAIFFATLSALGSAVAQAIHLRTWGSRGGPIDAASEVHSRTDLRCSACASIGVDVVSATAPGHQSRPREFFCSEFPEAHGLFGSTRTWVVRAIVRRKNLRASAPLFPSQSDIYAHITIFFYVAQQGTVVGRQPTSQPIDELR
jgi:hypothetical protein